MAKSIYQSEIIFNLNSRLFVNTLDGITESQARERISDHNNNLIWLAAHTVWARYNTSMFLGNPPAKNPYDTLYANFKPYDPVDTYPRLAEVKTECQTAPALHNEPLESVSEEHIAANPTKKGPIGTNINSGTTAF